MLRSSILYLVSISTLSETLLIKILSPRYKGSAISRTIKILLREGLLNLRTDGITLSATGRLQLEKSFKPLDKDKTGWDGLWIIVSFNIPEKKRYLRDKLRRVLYQEGYRLWNGSFWIAPWRSEIIDDFILTNKQVCIEIFKAIRLHSEPTEVEMVRSLYSVEKLTESYRSISGLWSASFDGNYTISEQRQLAKKLISKYITTLYEDPGLPDKLLPEDYRRNECSALVWEWIHFIKI
jgi:phenylacetic acid degradation operon negative regulatory protein